MSECNECGDADAVADWGVCAECFQKKTEKIIERIRGSEA